MFSLLIRRIAYGVMVMAGVVSLVFLLFQGLGDPARLVMGQRADKTTEENIRKELYLDQPRWRQFLYYLNDISPLSVHPAKEIEQKELKGIFWGGDVKWGIKWPYLRRSYQSKRQVTELLREALPGTALLALTAMMLACVLGIPLGVIAATRKGTIWDTSSLVTAILGISTPSFFMAIFISYVFGFLLSHYTGLSMSGGLYVTDAFEGRQLALANLLLPAITLGIRPMAIITQLTRSAMLDVLGKDYIRTAYAKGLKPGAIIWTHALRNALNPVITAVTGWLAELLAGAFFVEYIFGWQGLGKLTVDALEKLDFPVLMGSVLLSSLIFIVISLVADILYAWADPRIRLK